MSYIESMRACVNLAWKHRPRQGLPAEAIAAQVKHLIHKAAVKRPPPFKRPLREPGQSWGGPGMERVGSRWVMKPEAEAEMVRLFRTSGLAIVDIAAAVGVSHAFACKRISQLKIERETPLVPKPRGQGPKKRRPSAGVT